MPGNWEHDCQAGGGEALGVLTSLPGAALARSEGPWFPLLRLHPIAPMSDVNSLGLWLLTY